MLRIHAFQGLRPADGLAHLVACVPYDVVDRQEAAALAVNNPHSLLHVDRAEIDLDPGIDAHADAVYAKARENFIALQRDGVLVREEKPSIYLYEQRMGAHSQTGVATVCHIEDYENNLIKKHEKTRRDKEDDRTRLIDTISADTGPVFLTYRDSAGIDRLVEQEKKDPPRVDFTAPDGIRHIVWPVRNAAAFVEAFGRVPAAYVADGHHRTASAVRVGRERRAANPAHTGTENYNWFLSVLFPAGQLRILPYNRTVKTLNGHTPESLLARLGEAVSVRREEGPLADRPGKVSMYLGGRWYGLSWEPSPEADPISKLDVTVLQDRILAPIFGIDDPRTSTGIEFVGGIRGNEELTARVNDGRAAAAFSMHPVTVTQLMEIADAGQIMPPKSTWFEPKLRSGLFIHTLD